MKAFMIALAGLGILAVSAAAQSEKPAPKASAAPAAGGEVKDLTSRVSYSIGQDIGKKMKAQSLDVNPEELAKGLADALAGKSRMTEVQIRETMQEFQQVMTAKLGEIADKVKKDSEQFLAANKKKAGVVTSRSGLQYQVIKEGTGKSPKASDTVTVNYEGKLIDGTVFDSSYKRGQPATFPLGNVIRGWTEGVQLMKVGSKYKFFIPSDLAYGTNPRAGGLIRPNDALIFDIELLDVAPARGGIE